MSTEPSPRIERRRELARLAHFDRLSIFVPAVMSVGLLFWLLNEVRNVAGAQRQRSRAKRAELAAHHVAVRLGAPAGSTDSAGLRPRPVYVLLGMVLLAGAVYVAVGATANYLRVDGYVSSVGWLLALSLAVSTAAGVLGVASLAVAARYPTIPSGVRRLVGATPLSTRPLDGSAGPAPSWRLSAAMSGGWATFALLALTVGWSPHVLVSMNMTVSEWARRRSLPGPTWALDLLGSTPVAVALTLGVVIGLRRCRVLFVGSLAAVVVSQLGGHAVRVLTAHPRPAGGALSGRLDSFPSGHLLLLTLLAGSVPLLLSSRRHDRWARGAQVVLAAVVVIAGYHRVNRGNHWPVDVAGGVLLGVTLILSVRWSVAIGRVHRHCGDACRWKLRTVPREPIWAAAPSTLPPPRTPRRRGLLPLGASRAATVRTAAHLTSAAAALALTGLGLTVGLPVATEATGFVADYGNLAQLSLAGLVSVSAMVGWRWPAPAAATMAVAATGLGLLAALEYPPTAALAVAAGLMVPAFLLWLSWQHRRHLWEIVVLAVVTVALVTGTWVGASRVYDSFYGPTHPASEAPDLPVDRVRWTWLGGLGPNSITISAQLAAEHVRARAVAVSADGAHAARSPETPVVQWQVVQLPLDDLRPDTIYRYVIEVDGVADRSRGAGTFHTPGQGPYSFRFAVGSCSRTGSNGAVFDQIVAQDPLFMLQLGDLHYENLRAERPGPFLEAYGEALTEPGQAALARTVPMAYIWDDHDFGPNDADRASPTRAAVHAAYRAAVPHYPLEPDGSSMQQAFTIGRVRFVLTDGRSERTATTLLGDAQRRWLVDEVRRSSRTHALVVWANPTPWIGPDTPGADTWAGHAAERTEIANAFADAGVTNLLMVSGDAHMVAIDDGTNADYATRGSAAFPVLHAAALDRPGNAKGGPYSEGAYPGGGQFGIVEVHDDGRTIDVELRGVTWDGTTIVSLHHRVPTGPST